MTFKISIPKEKVKVANRKIMIARCRICKKRFYPHERYLDEDYFGWNTMVHVSCWLNYRG